jgi:hypothetical protein
MWDCDYVVETKEQSSDWKSLALPCPKKAQQAHSQAEKVVCLFVCFLFLFFCCFFYKYHRGIVHNEFTSEGQTINQDFYLVVLRHLQDAVQSKQPRILTEGSWLFNHNNAPVHIALSFKQFLTKHSILTFPRPSYSPDLFPPNFSIP